MNQLGLKSQFSFRPLRAAMFLVLAAAGAANAQVDPVTTFTGDGTTYDLGGGTPASSLPAAEISPFYAAMGPAQFGNSEWCGAWVEVTGPAGSAVVQIVDLCPECDSGDLDLSPTAFMQITGASNGRFPISWKWVTAPGDIGPVHFYSEGSNPYYLKLQVANTQNPPVSMEILISGSYVAMSRTSDFHFVRSGSAIAEPFTIRVTDILGNQLVSPGLTIAGTAAASGQNGSGNFPPPSVAEIVVEDAAGVEIADGGSRDVGFSVDGDTSSALFTIRNPGDAALTDITITKDGANATDFTIASGRATSVPAGGTTTFTVAFATAVKSARSAAIHISSNAANPALVSYDIMLTGRGLSSADDGDSDGLNDGSEARMAALGFDWQIPQPALVNLYYGNATLAGLYTPAQVKTLHMDVPLLERNPTTGKFTLQLGLRKSTDLGSFEPFPFTAPNVSVNGSGKIEFKFTSPENAEFFRVEAE